MISNSRLKKIEEKVKESKRKDYKYIFSTHKEYEQGKLDGIVDPDGSRVLILNDLEDDIEMAKSEPKQDTELRRGPTISDLLDFIRE